MASNLQKQIRQLEELSRLQRRFVSDVSHELRTPITTVRMASDVIHDAKPFLDPVTGRAAELLQKELDRFETLLADLLEISRFDAGAAVLETEDVDLVDVARRVVDMTSALAAQRDTRVVVHDPGTPCVAEADVRRVERIVRNLVTNAIDHAESPRRRDLRRRRPPVRRHRGPRPRRRARAGGVGDGLQPVLARRPGARPHQRRHRARPVDLARGHPPARRVAPGVGSSRRGCPVPADPAAPASAPSCATRRCRWSPSTPGRPHERQHDEPSRRPRGAGRARARPGRRRAAGGLRADADLRPGASSPRCTSGSEDAPGISFDPRPPQAGQATAEIVEGFLEAMKATPVSASVARQFLSREAAEAWVPEQQIITYAELGDPTAGTSVRVPLTDVNTYDARGAWQRTRGGAAPLPRPGQGGRRVAHRRGARRPHRAGDVVRRLVRAGLALLLRPHDRDPGPRAGVRAPRRPVRLVAGARAADPVVLGPAGRRAQLLPAGHHARPLGADHLPASPRSRSPATRTRWTS